MTILKVNAFTVNTNKEYDYFGDETGTSDFYVVQDTLIKYLGDENVYVNWDYNEFFFIIEDRGDSDEGYDNTCDYIQTIESIYEPFDFPPGIYENNKNDHLVFQIIYDE
jgi:hypothetical protein